MRKTSRFVVQHNPSPNEQGDWLVNVQLQHPLEIQSGEGIKFDMKTKTARVVTDDTDVYWNEPVLARGFRITQ